MAKGRRSSKKRKTYAGFKSKRSWRWAFATKQPWAREKAHKTKGGPKVRYRRLPESKHSGAGKKVYRRKKR
ncbi:hypothetical protein SEA_GIUSEPPE_10 [Mycobacterium phage Giuseppe]|uniref:Uncharacterized protein n=5 Tax=Plotvirus plot TaxID=2170099 RepID=B5U3N7_9CAUD|nr:gp9 [Mycobacterium phage Gumball]ACD49595.1 hypothetical protein Adjutor_10 [Mycobacterium phage Adjutor]AEK10219.1 hypothetical protein PBI_SIRHARLEY_9 [Mycobacterium phage SirHarley]AYN58152.1 hypothetical protein SEA_KANDZ_10 [Mycobacterium phage KandZ]QFG14159.1 hypothetical protein SEA_GIUSEPPE_10 [Mycobacterium phage Giuseppe]ACI06383.1 hypothetical protein GUMBALL_9 [Mycobacterium phage Gumball]